MSAKTRDVGTRGDSGFALILAILSLMLLTFLGLTLAATTSTELQIASNYRWQRQAYYNAQAGLEAGKTLLRFMNWSLILPAARTTPWDPTVDPTLSTNWPIWTAPHTTDKFGGGVRVFESGPCDKQGAGAGYGVVLDDGSAQGPYQYVTTPFPGGPSVNGAFTLWVRRPVVTSDPTAARGDAVWTDYDADDTLLVTSEGVAPFTGAGMASGFGRANAASVVVQAVFSRVTNPGGCDKRGGQTGGGSEGSGFGACDPLIDPSVTGAGSFLGSGINVGSQGGTGGQIGGGSAK